MSLLQLINQINNEDFSEEQKNQSIGRKQALGKMTNFSKKLALTAVPLGGMAAAASTAKAASSTPSDTDILNYALTLEFLERNFYNQGVKSGVIPSSDMPVFQKIQKHEQEHVAFLQSALGDDAISEDTYTYDYTAGGNFKPFDDYPTFLTLSVGFEDTGVRAYKGQAGNISDKDLLSAALRIHSVEARHASEVRRLYASTQNADTKGWITGAGKNVPKPIKPLYGADDTYNLSEGNTTQAGVDITNFVSSDAASEAFDEPVGMDFVTGFLTSDKHPFLKKNNS
jgi:rubrerythrin